MKERRLIHICTVLLSIVFLLTTLAGCGSKNNPGEQGSNMPQVAVQTPPPAENSGEDGTIRVSSVEELIEAIRPDAEIIIEPGRYDLTDFLADFPDASDREVWNDEHEYVQINDAYDGPELVVRNVTGLHIEGGTEDPADTEIVTRPRHATVLGFQNCSDMELACLTMGHTDGGKCSGNVLNFYNCQNIRLRTMDLYGCGVVGIGALHGCGDFVVSNSTIRDCSDGPFEIYEASGAFVFTGCTLAGSEGSGWFHGKDGSSLSFAGCSFGQEESNGWYWYWDLSLDDRVTFADCDWTEVTEHPGFEPGYDEFYSDCDEYVPDLDALIEIPFDSSMLNNTFWSGYAVVDSQSGDTYYFHEGAYESVYGDHVSLEIYENGEACLEYRGETLDLKLYMIDEDIACLENAEHRLYVSLYQNGEAENNDYYWLLMQYDNELVWFDM